MEDAKVILENGTELSVSGIFYIFNSKYYFMYTEKEKIDDDYVQLYVVQVCKEVQNTINGPVDTGYLLGIETTDASEWSKVQESITIIVDEKKTGKKNSAIQYLPINMLANLKIVSKNKFKLMTHLLSDVFNLEMSTNQSGQEASTVNQDIQQELNVIQPMQPSQPIELSQLEHLEQPSESVELSQLQQSTQPSETPSMNQVPDSNTNVNEDIIVDYRTKFFEQQDKNKELQEQIKILQEKLESIKNII